MGARGAGALRAGGVLRSAGAVGAGMFWRGAGALRAADFFPGALRAGEYSLDATDA